MPLLANSVTQPRACVTVSSVGSICTDTGVENTGTYGRDEVSERERVEVVSARRLKCFLFVNEKS